MHSQSKIFVAGHRGLVGSAITRTLRERGFTNLLLRGSEETDLRDGRAVDAMFRAEKPDYVFLAAAKVGGIGANKTYPADFIRDNLLIQTHVIDAAWRNGVSKLLFLGSSCIYPRDCAQPIGEEALLTGTLEKTNEPYAVAKIAGIKMCQAYNRQYGTHYITGMPTNLYGPGDNFHLENSHVLPAMIRKFHEALPDAPVTLWGSGAPRREFLHASDLADACIHLMLHHDGSDIVNLGTGEDIAIRDLAELIQNVVGHRGEIIWDQSQPDGTPRKWLNVNRLRALGWRHRIGLREGIAETYAWFRTAEGRESKRAA
jgi:GDP-L-fucose synthase